MLGFKVADPCHRGGLTRLQLLEDHVLLGLVAGIRIVLKILDDRLHDVIIRPLGAIKDRQLAIQNQQQFFNVAVLVAQDIDDLLHRLMPCGDLSLIRWRRPIWTLAYKTTCSAHLRCKSLRKIKSEGLLHRL